MTGRYAANTTVPVARSRDELHRTLARYGATETLVHEQPGALRMPEGLLPSLAPAAKVIELPERAGGAGR